MNKLKHIMPCALCLALCACGETRVVDLNNQADVESMQHVMELEYRDWENAATKMTDSMLKSGAFARVANPVIAIDDIKNDTMQRIDTDLLVKKIRKTIVNSGRAQIATTFTGEETMSNKMRAMRGNSEYNASTIAEQGTLVAPNISLSGKMIQRNLNLKSGWFSNVDTRVEYYMQLTLTDLKTGLSIWEEEEPIVKEGDHAPTW
ncbi:MAG: penicillin-binding protein activator LpoB [Alphaproteobacteria bacterium]|nr:penicillin-binding protein activator LpoB [Alphaproteobacteria bacterium]